MRLNDRDGNKDERARWPSRAVRRWLAATVLAACSDHEGVVRGKPISRLVMTDVILTVDNRTPKPVRVYLESSARSDSLGSVPRQSIRSFSVPSGVGDSTVLHLRALAPGSLTGVRSQAFHLARGDQVVWTLDRERTTVTTR